MRFGPWYPLADARAEAPASAGVFQVKLARGLCDYPRGKSAMVHYQAARDLRRAAGAFAAANAGTPWSCRHTVEMSPAEQTAAEVDRHHARLLQQFVDRFGAPPGPPTLAIRRVPEPG